jgi:tRNA pseudouridine38-40 synthase
VVGVLGLRVAYDGTGFAGFAAQPGQRTVQGVLEDALSAIAGEPVRVAAAGRTDAGVHALGQVVSLAGVRDLAADDVFRALAGRFPQDVSVIDATPGPPGFDARRSAQWRSYSYLLWSAPAPHPLFGRFTTWTTSEIDVGALREALRVVVGTHDFRSFARVRPEQSPIRTVIAAGAERDGDLVRINIAANAFLHQMVRSIVGSALEVATGRRTGSWMREALLACDRSAAGRVATARGLTFVDVGYDDILWRRAYPVPWPWSHVNVMNEMGACP